MTPTSMLPKAKTELRCARSCGRSVVALAVAVVWVGMPRVMLGERVVVEAAAEIVQAELPVKRFKIEEGRLDEALEEYRRQSGVTLKVEISAEKLAGFKTNGVTGLYENDAALRLLLVGTGLSFRFEEMELAVIGLRHQESVEVGVTDSVGLTTMTEPLVMTPQTVEVIPEFILKDQQNTTLQDALRNVPGISMAAGDDDAQGNSMTIRGFSARSDIFLDGIRDFGSYYRDSFNYEQVEVLQGPAGVQFGRGSTGGVINQESKVPAADRFVEVRTLFGTDGTRRGTVDVNVPLGKVVAGSAVRFNAMGTEAGVAGRPYDEGRRFGFAPTITFGLNSPTRLTVGYYHLTENDTPDYGLPWLYNKLAPGVNRHAYFGFPTANFLRTNDDIVTARVNHAYSPSVELHTIGRWANYPRNVQITEPQICSNPGQDLPVGTVVTALPTSAFNTALPCPYTLATPAAQITVNRNQIQLTSVEGELWGQVEVTALFKVKGVRNDLVTGVEGGREVSSPQRTSYTESGINSVPSTNLAAPNPAAAFSGTGYVSAIVHTKALTMGVYTVDTVKLGRYFEVSGGVRWDLFDTLYNLYAPATKVVGASLSAAVKPTSQTVEHPSFRGAVVYVPNAHGAIYFDAGTSYDPSGESLSLTVATSVLPPEANYSMELGAKDDLLAGKLQLAGALFRTEKENARETNPANSSQVVLAGNQQVEGVQASAIGRMGGGTDLILGYAFLDSKVVASQEYPLSVGYPLANVPKQTFNAFVTHNVGWKVTAGLGGNYLGSRTASSTVPFVPTAYAVNPSGAGYLVTSTAVRQVAGYWAFNAMIRRPVTDKIQLQANFYNLLNRFFIDQPSAGHLIPGAGFSALVGATFRF